MDGCNGRRIDIMCASCARLGSHARVPSARRRQYEACASWSAWVQEHPDLPTAIVCITLDPLTLFSRCVDGDA